MSADRSEPPQFYAPDRQVWRDWLRDNHATSRGVWLVTNKKPSGLPHLSYDEAVREALCWGWIDSVPRKLDALRSQLYFSPRKPGSGWSKLNKTRVEDLLSRGEMQGAGLAKIEAARQDGSWNALDKVEAGELAPDLQSALNVDAEALANWNAFPPSARRGILEWIQNAKKPETRRARIQETVTLAARNERANSFKRKTP